MLNEHKLINAIRILLPKKNGFKNFMLNYKTCFTIKVEYCKAVILKKTEY